VGWCPAPYGHRVAPGVAAATAAAARRFEELGARVEEAKLPGTDPTGDVWVRLWAAGSAAMHRHDLSRVRGQIDPGRLPMIEAGFALSGPEVAELQMLRAAHYHTMREFMAGYDLLLMPTVARTAFEAGANGPKDVGGEPLEQPWDWVFTPPVNLTGFPAASVPVGFDEGGLPVGLQLIGRWRDDATVFAAAAAYEAAAPWRQHLPALD
jgi:aspartyl-tRNA(Asn)/glutamyl-tRNA(Gln) amidotransferase subunit A